jgi:ATPase subunit of ABC transporter with duplicated ATPase domains
VLAFRHHGQVLQVRDLTVEVGGRILLTDATFTVRAGDKVGLVGRNGAGKTSLLKVVAGAAVSRTGSVHRPPATGYLPQEPRGLERLDPGLTALGHVLSGRGLADAVVHLEKLRTRVDEDPSERNVAKFARAEDAFRDAGGYASESEVRRICAGLGLTADRVDLPLAVLSGGERRRVELARILFAGSDLLLLDEPTNHLDTDAVGWLLGFLRGYRGALVVISHDLVLLDEAITRVLHLEDEALIEYRGTYSQYRDARVRDEERLTRLATRQGIEITRLQALANSMRGQTEKRAKTAKAIDTRVSHLQAKAVSGPTKERKLRVRFPEPPHAGRVVLEVDEVAKRYDGPPVFDDVSFALERGERLLVLGLNGAGKSSLLRILAGWTDASAGAVAWGHGASPGYYAQEHEGLLADTPVLDHLTTELGLPMQQGRALLGMFGLTGELVHRGAGTLSGGEKTKLALAQLVAGRHNVLLLDEPTNNLDPPSRESVAAALSAWPGAMVLVSHDTDFVERLVPHRVLTMPEGTLDYWRDDLLELVALA